MPRMSPFLSSGALVVFLAFSTRASRISTGAFSQMVKACTRIAARVASSMIGAAAGRQHMRRLAQKPRDHRALQPSRKSGSPIFGENLGHGHAGRRLDLMIGIAEGTSSRAASRLPMEVLPAPIMPTSATVLFSVLPDDMAIPIHQRPC